MWGNQQGSDDVDQTESVRLFVCLVIDAIYRDCDFASVQHLWDLLVASNGQHSVLFGATCRESDALVSMTLVLRLMCYARVACEFMLHVFVFISIVCIDFVLVVTVRVVSV